MRAIVTKVEKMDHFTIPFPHDTHTSTIRTMSSCCRSPRPSNSALHSPCLGPADEHIYWNVRRKVVFVRGVCGWKVLDSSDHSSANDHCGTNSIQSMHDEIISTGNFRE